MTVASEGVSLVYCHETRQQHLVEARRFLMLRAPAVSLLGTMDLMGGSLQAFLYWRIRIRHPHDDFVLLPLAAHRRLR